MKETILWKIFKAMTSLLVVFFILYIQYNKNDLNNINTILKCGATYFLINKLLNWWI